MTTDVTARTPAASMRPPVGAGRGVVALFTVTSFVAAALLFLVQPLVAKLVLPSFGGTPTVWTTSSLFFQVLLLGGYAYVHLSTRRLARGRQPLLHLGLLLLPLLALPMALPDDVAPSADDNPVWWLLRVLILTVGAPFALVATSGPLLQRWFSWTDHPRRDDPYFLYAAGNVGSIVGLLGYPFLLEPRTTLGQQTATWSAGYVVLLLLVAACGLVALRARRQPLRESAVAPPAAGTPVTTRRRLRWIGLSFLPSAVMLGATAHLTADIAPVPLLWVVPLAIYLVTFVVAFARPGSIAVRGASVGVAVLVVPGILSALGWRPSVAIGVALHLGLVAVVGLTGHGRLAQDRPETARLTEFYLLVSVGGALGGLLGGVLAPILLESAVEYPLVLAASLLLVGPTLRRWLGDTRSPLPWARLGSPRVRHSIVLLAAVALVGFGIYLIVGPGDPSGAILILLVLMSRAAYLLRHRVEVMAAMLVALVIATDVHAATTSTFRERTFFGSYEVDRTDGVTTLIHGTTSHGSQDVDSPTTPTTYYTRGGPLGDVVDAVEDADRIAVVGLGTGTMAAYGRPGQVIDFYEIDPEIERIARDPSLFTYLRDSPADVEVVLGDGRIELAASTGEYDLIVLDAFSSDAIPVHLLTVEALEIFSDQLSLNGVLAVHLSNRHLDLAPVVGAAVQDLGLQASIRADDENGGGVSASVWMAVAATEESLEPLAQNDEWSVVDPGDARPWTDDYSSLLSVLSWR